MKKKLLLLIILLITIFSFNSIIAKQKYEIKNTFKDTNYKVLNDEIHKNLNMFIDEFKKEIDDCNDSYYINITYNIYEYNNYLSYVFYIESYIGGAHPNHKIWTIIYDKDSDSIINIDTLFNKYIVDTNMMLEGTKPIKENFSNFVFTEDGILILFEYYQIAPYASGEFKVIIPYNSIVL